MNESQHPVSGSRIRLTRKKQGITQEHLSEIVDISRTYMSAIECEEAVPSLPVLIRIAKVLDVPVDYLLNIDSIPESVLSEVELLKDCSNEEVRILVGNMKNLKGLIRRYGTQGTE